MNLFIINAKIYKTKMGSGIYSSLPKKCEKHF